jgi:hypothetical protein
VIWLRDGPNTWLSVWPYGHRPLHELLLRTLSSAWWTSSWTPPCRCSSARWSSSNSCAPSDPARRSRLRRCHRRIAVPPPCRPQPPLSHRGSISSKTLNSNSTLGTNVTARHDGGVPAATSQRRHPPSCTTGCTSPTLSQPFSLSPPPLPSPPRSSLSNPTPTRHQNGCTRKNEEN